MNIPFNNEAEQGLIGAMMVTPQLIIEIEAEFPNVSEFFYDLRHREIFKAMRTTGTGDLGILQPHLRDLKQLEAVGGMAYLAGLSANAVGMHFEAQGHAQVLQNDFIKRRLLQLSAEIEKFVEENPEATSALAETEKRLMEIGQSSQSGSDPTIMALMLDVQSDIDKAIQNNGRIRGLATGVRDFDRMTHGLKGGQMIVLAGRPGGGKTSLAMNIADNVAVDQKQPVGIFSLEMTAKELVMRLVSARSRIDSGDIEDGRLFEENKPAMFMAMRQIQTAPFHICDKGGLTVAQLGARARRMAIHHKIKLLVVDYLQLMQSRLKENGNARVTEISNGLKTLAKDLDIPILVLSQLNRDSEKENRKPRLSDLRESGSIEQDADMVLMLSPDGQPTDGKQKVDVLIPKHRSGPVGKFELMFQKNITRFYDIEIFASDCRTPYEDK